MDNRLTNKETTKIVIIENWRDTELKCRVQHSIPVDVLVISGITLDSAELLGPREQNFWPKPTTMEEFQITKDTLKHSIDMFEPSSKYVTGEAALEACTRTLVTSFLPLFTSENLLQSFEAWKRWIFSGGEDGCWSDLVDGYIQGLAMARVFHQHKFCITTKGFMCVMPAICAQGDVIGIFTGGRVPYVLRRRGDFFELIGYCYVHGFMDGSVSAGALLQNLEKRQSSEVSCRKERLAVDGKIDCEMGETKTGFCCNSYHRGRQCGW